MKRFSGLAMLLVALAACHTAHEREATAGNAAAASVVVDSVIPIDVALRRFRKDLPETAVLRSGVASRDTLVKRVVDALAANDSLTFEKLALNRAEWAWLYYPTSTIARPPYELPPALAWFQLQEANRKGVLRALRELGGHHLYYRGYRCSPDAKVEGDNRIWTGCTVTLSRDGEEPTSVKLFSAILERHGRFAILSYDNDF